MVSLVGALAVTAMTFYLPFLMHWKVRGARAPLACCCRADGAVRGITIS